MRCKRHTVDFSSNFGVCASCLRERLLSLAASAAISEENLYQSSKKSTNHHPPLLIFPRSVSPYVTRRKSDAAGGRDSNHQRRFFTTPQVDLGISCKDFQSVSVSNSNPNRSVKSKRGGGGGFYRFFRTRSEDLDPRFSSDVVSEISTTSSSRSWISTILSTGRSKKQQPTTTTTACYIEDVIAGGGRSRPQRVFCRGMSPARETEPEDEQELPSESIEETPGRLRTTPASKTPGRRKITNGMGKMGFCLSPLVRASPNCPFKRKIRFPPSDFGTSGEITAAPEKPHISAAASFCANRSKKLVDLGRVNPRR